MSTHLLVQFLDAYKAQLRDEITASVVKAMEERLSTFTSGVDDGRLLNISQLSELLCISKSSIELLKKEGLPYLKIKDSTRYIKKDALQFIQKYKAGGAMK